MEAQFPGSFVKSHQAVMVDIFDGGGNRPDQPISLKDASQSITENGHQLITEVDSLGCELGSHILSTQATGQEWSQNVLNLEGFLEAGKFAGEARVAALLTNLQSQELQCDDGGASGALFGDAMDGEGNVTWADVAVKQGRAIRKLSAIFIRD